MDTVIGHLDAQPDERREIQRTRYGVREVRQRAAALAHEVVVSLDARVEARHGAGVGDLAQDFRPDKGLQDAVHRRPRQSWQTRRDALEDLIGRGVVRPIHGGFQDHASLHRQGETVGPAQRPGASQAVGVVDGCLHIITKWENIAFVSPRQVVALYHAQAPPAARPEWRLSVFRRKVQPNFD